MKNKKKKIPSLPIFLSSFLILASILYVFADDIIILIPTQIAISNGSNQSLIEFSKAGTTGGETYYADEGANSTVIGNYFKGFYYDSIMGFFQLDWSANPSENVNIISSTEKCGNSYGYKLGGNAYSPYYGFMDFEYSPSVFVYYCEGDKKLHGFAYSEYNGFQNFEGIGFEILPFTGAIVSTTSSDLFVNDTTSIDKKGAYTGADTNYGKSGIGGDIFNIDDTKESIIYIIR